MPEPILDWGIQLVLAMQGLGDWLDAPMFALTYTGYVEFYLLVMPAIYWCWSRHLGLQLGIALMISMTVSFIAKVLFHQPRPYWVDPRVQLLARGESSYGIPSNHAMTTLVIWALLANYVRCWWAWLIAILVTLLVGVSRIHLGVHYPTDVLAGWIIGAILVVLIVRLEAPILNRLHTMTAGAQVAGVLLVSLLLIAAGVLITRTVEAGWQIPSDWIQNALAHDSEEVPGQVSLKFIVESGAAFFGFCAGAILLREWGGFDAGGVWYKRVARYLIGIVGAFVLWDGLDIVFEMISPDETVLGFTLRFVRYAALAAWISGFGPWLFLRLKLAEPDHVPPTQQMEDQHA